jgi:flagellar basal body rod protein FlgC
MTLEIKSPLQTAIGGLQKQEIKVAKAAEDISKSFTAAQNAIAADSVAVSDRAAVVPAVEDAVRGAVLPAEGDVSQAIVDLLQAATAYKANASVVRVTSDLQETTMDIIGKRGL